MKTILAILAAGGLFSLRAADNTIESNDILLNTRKADNSGPIVWGMDKPASASVTASVGQVVTH